MAESKWTDEERLKAAEQVYSRAFEDKYPGTPKFWVDAIADPSSNWRETNPITKSAIDLQLELNEARKLLQQSWAPYPAGMEWSAYSEQTWKNIKNEWLARNGEKD